MAKKNNTEEVVRICLNWNIVVILRLERLHSSGIKFDYQYDVEFDSKLKTLDKFLFLVDMHYYY